MTLIATTRLLSNPSSLRLFISHSQAPRSIACRHFSNSVSLLSGHNKWSTIKHDKAKNDAMRNKMSTKYGAQIAVAARIGGPDPAHNVRLATAIENANRSNVPKKIIESAIRRGAGLDKDAGAPNTESAIYEGMGPGGVAFVVEALTDNKSRTVSHVKSAFVKGSGMISPTVYLFTRRGWIQSGLKQGVESIDDALEELIEFGAEDVIEDDVEPEESMSTTNAATTTTSPIMSVYTTPQDTAKVAQEMKAAGYPIKDMGIEYAPNPDTAISEDSISEENKAAYLKLAQALDDLDDVIEVYTNVV